MNRAADIRRLASTKAPQDVVPVLVAASRDPDHAVREAAMFALDRLDVDTTEYLSAGLDDEDEWVRLRAAVGMGRRGDHRGRDVLAMAAQSDDHDAALLSVEGLGALGEEDALVNIVIDPAESPPLREAAIDALRHCQSANATNALEQAARDPNRFVRRAARRVLASDSRNPI
jgi:HEAT repeat protein